MCVVDIVAVSVCLNCQRFAIKKKTTIVFVNVYFVALCGLLLCPNITHGASREVKKAPGPSIVE